MDEKEVKRLVESHVAELIGESIIPAVQEASKDRKTFYLALIKNLHIRVSKLEGNDIGHAMTDWPKSLENWPGLPEL